MTQIQSFRELTNMTLILNLRELTNMTQIQKFRELTNMTQIQKFRELTNDPDPKIPGAHKYDPDPNTTRSLLRKYICPHKSSRLNIDCPTRPPPAEKMLDPPLLPMILSLLFYRNDFPPYLYGMSFGYTGISTSLPVLIFISPSSSPVPLPLLQLL